MGGRRDGRRHQRTHGNGNGIGRGEHQRHERRGRACETRRSGVAKRGGRTDGQCLSSIRSSALPFEPTSTPFPVAPSVIRSFSFCSFISIVDTDEVRWTGTNVNGRSDGSDSKRNGRLTVACVCCVGECGGACGECSSASCARIVCVVLVLLAVAACAVPWHRQRRPVPAASAWRPTGGRRPPSSSVLVPHPSRSRRPASLLPPASSSACCSSSCSA